MDNKKIWTVCENFLKELGEAATQDNIFPILREVGQHRGLALQAHQRGINGTFIHFVKEEAE